MNLSWAAKESSPCTSPCLGRISRWGWREGGTSNVTRRAVAALEGEEVEGEMFNTGS